MNTTEQNPRQAPRHITAALRNSGGWMGFDRYMELALYHPDEGYYGAGRARFGEGGDFDTAPETSRLFGRVLAGQCTEILAACQGGDIVELGGGSGRLAEIMLAEFAANGELPQRYLLVEPAPGMRAVQRERLARAHPDLMDRIEWVDRLTHERVRGVILANEVIDALPCKCFGRSQGRWRERGVSIQGGQLAWEERPPDMELKTTLDDLQAELPWALGEGYCSEIRPELDAFIGELSQSLEAGVVLLADYGLPRHELYLAERSEGTLGCHFDQCWHDDPFHRPGQQDITAWVDFTAVKRSAEAAGLSAVGFTTQAQFLLAANILELAGSPPEPQEAASLRRLMLPGGMGEAFKFMALSTEEMAAPSGFDGRDLLGSLDPSFERTATTEAATA